MFKRNKTAVKATVSLEKEMPTGKGWAGEREPWEGRRTGQGLACVFALKPSHHGLGGFGTYSNDFVV